MIAVVAASGSVRSSVTLRLRVFTEAPERGEDVPDMPRWRGHCRFTRSSGSRSRDAASTRERSRRAMKEVE